MSTCVPLQSTKPMSARYLRQEILPEIGTEGQKRLAAAKVLVVGAGGLGSPVLLYLAAAGVGQASAGGKLGLIDDDRVERSNLQRQVLFSEADVGESKVLAAVRHLQANNPEIAFAAIQARLGVDNVLDVMADYDVVVDGSDNFPTKYLLNDAAVKLGKPLVYGAILGFEGRASVFWAKHGPCYRCLFPVQPVAHVPNCAEAGILGGVAGLIGSVQAVEVVKLALGLAYCQHVGLQPLLGRILTVDARSFDTYTLDIPKSPSCPVCSLPPEQIVLSGEEGAALCLAGDLPVISWPDFQERRLSGQPIRLFDVRDEAAWQQHHLPGAISLPLSRLMAQEEWPDALPDEGTIYVYCQIGQRSRQAAAFLRSRGINAIVLDVDWAQAG